MFLVKFSKNVIFHINGFEVRAVAVHHLSIAANQKLGEVLQQKIIIELLYFKCSYPFDRVKQETRTVFVVFQPFIDGLCLVSIHIRFRHHVKGDAIRWLSKVLNLSIAARFLTAELIWREGDYAESIVLILFIERLELGILTLGQASFGGNVNDDGDKAEVLGQVDFVAINVGCWEAANVCSRLSVR